MPRESTLDGEARLGTSESDRLAITLVNAGTRSLSARAAQPRPSRAASPALQLAGRARQLLAFF